MVSQDDMYPKFPILECQVCQEHFEVPRKWVATQSLGNQILIDWDAADELMNIHNRNHIDTLVQETEKFLASQ
jgi:hypothetical protein